jgi:hypothetical protein
MLLQLLLRLQIAYCVCYLAAAAAMLLQLLAAAAAAHLEVCQALEQRVIVKRIRVVKVVRCGSTHDTERAAHDKASSPGCRMCCWLLVLLLLAGLVQLLAALQVTRMISMNCRLIAHTGVDVHAVLQALRPQLL